VCPVVWADAGGVAEVVEEDHPMMAVEVAREARWCGRGGRTGRLWM